ncbi:MAG: hypothetical protein ACI9MC_001503 [Kiritimatiellia bacterium]
MGCVALTESGAAHVRALQARVDGLTSYPVARASSDEVAQIVSEVSRQLGSLPSCTDVEIVRCFAEFRFAACARIEGKLDSAFRTMMGCLHRADRLGNIDLQAAMWLDLAMIHRTTGRHREAFRWLERAMALGPSAPQHARLRVNMACSLRASGRI